MKLENILTLDFETTTHNKGHPFDLRNEAVSYATLANERFPDFKYYTDPDFIDYLGVSVADADALVGFNIKFDLHWLHNVCPLVDLSKTRVWDCQLAEFVYSGQEARLATLSDVCEKYGIPTKIDLVSDYWAQGIDTKEIPLSILKEYNKQDVQITKMLFDVQQKLLSTKQKRLVWLLGEDLKALQEAEYAGIRFDSEKANKRLTEYKQAISIIERHLSEFLPDGIAKTCFNFDSGDHLSALLYGGIISFDWAQEENAVYKSGAKIGEAYVKRSWFKTDIDFPQRFRPLDGTEVKKTREDPTARTRFYQVDAPTLSQLKTRLKENRELLTLLKARAEKIKVVEMIETIYRTMEKKQWNDSYIHGQFNQNIVITGRLSSSAPNLQNTPPEVDELLITRY